MPADRPPVPVPADCSLADVVPSVAAALGVEGFKRALEMPDVRRACVLLVDGLGFQQLLAHPAHAPFLAAAARGGRAVNAGFPATTATSVASVGTGLEPGEHGIVGYTMAVPGRDRPINNLSWTLYGAGPHVDLREEWVPERAQPRPTVFERVAASGVDVWQVAPRIHDRSGLTRAALRGGRFRAALAPGDLTAETLDALGSADRTLVYAYHAELDLVGHVRGVDSDAWRYHVAHVDRIASDIASGLGAGSAIVVTADHGMVDVDELVDVDREPELTRGVRMLGGEARARHVYCEPGAADDVLAAWRERLGSSMWVVSGDEAVAQGWFGPRVPDGVRERIGDVVAASHGATGVVQRSVDALQARLVGHHGSMTPGERLVPFLAVVP